MHRQRKEGLGWAAEVEPGEGPQPCCSENKAWRQQAQGSHHVPKRDPTTSPKPAEPLAGCLPQPRPPRWPRQLLYSCSQTLAAS